MTDIVLVHGAWSDSSVWEGVGEALKREGHRVLAVSLPLTSLADDVVATRRSVEACDGGVVLVGHSYGGAVISEAARGEGRVRALVFVAAYAPDEGESIAELSGRGATTPGRDAIRFGSDGWTSLDPARFRDALAADVPPERVRELARTQKATHSACLGAPAGRGAWHDLPSSYVLSAEDRILDPGLQRWFAQRAGATVVELAASHLSPVSRPEPVAAAISAAARGSGLG
ncbi:alpha/beta hydrolase [Amycolatopsis sp. NBC_01488]|uniref:alpha/beta fold hydrolase n=1 Tax=Amycolatopsis sp. NBC_01488 TaxID=2903563 RepID=UPI002E2C1F7F|nr:alpha/beta hydrolase [Amycolatopsis sp. NBC_01488]